MEETEATSFGFNKRRAEGRDKSDLPKKNLQLKVRKLNPANTISYVQVELGCFWGGFEFVVMIFELGFVSTVHRILFDTFFFFFFFM